MSTAAAMSAMDASVKAFNEEFDRLKKDLLVKQVATLQKKLVYAAVASLTFKTPVDTGLARANWQTSVGQPAAGVVSKDSDPIMAAAVAMSNPPPFTVAYISNNVEYIVYLEDGHSQQAPNGMVALTMQELRMMLP